MSEIISAIAYGDAEMLESLTETVMNTQEQSGLDERTYQMVRVAALVATAAPLESYSVSLSGTVDGLEVADLEAILIALTPVVGAATVAAGASAILEAFFEETDLDVVAEQHATDVPIRGASSAENESDADAEAIEGERDSVGVAVHAFEAEPIEVEEFALAGDEHDDDALELV